MRVRISFCLRLRSTCERRWRLRLHLRLRRTCEPAFRLRVQNGGTEKVLALIISRQMAARLA